MSQVDALQGLDQMLEQLEQQKAALSRTSAAEKVSAHKLKAETKKTIGDTSRQVDQMIEFLQAVRRGSADQPADLRQKKKISQKNTYSAALLRGDGEKCTAGRIADEDRCRQAAINLGLPYGSAWHGPDDHPGCIFADDARQKVFFNTAPNANGESQLR